MNRRQLLKTTAGVIGSAGATLAGTYFYGRRVETEWLELVEVRVPIEGLESGLDGFRIALLSDFHLYPHTRIEFVREAVDVANSLAPDLAVLTGDFVLRRADSIFELAPALARLQARHGVFSTLGNHDHWRGAAVVRRGLEESTLPLLENRGVTLVHNGAALYLAGVDDGWAGRPDLAAALDGHAGHAPVILLSHLPDLADLFLKDSRVRLQLSGHSHGGQVRIPGLGAPFLPPYGRKYDLGLYRIGGSWLYTNRGIGVTAPIRINCRPEVTALTLSRA